MNITPLSARGHATSEALDLLLMESLPSEARAQLERHLGDCHVCQSALSELKADQQHFNRFVYPRTVQAVEASGDRRGTPWLRWMPAVGLAGLALVAVAVLNVGQNDEQQPYIGVKGPGSKASVGAPELEVFARRPNGAVFSVTPGATLKVGDQLRFAVNPKDFTHVLVVSVDGASQFSVYVPFDGAQAAQVIQEKKQELPGAVELDETVGREKLVAVFAKRSVTAKEVATALSMPGQPVIGGAVIEVLEFVKER